MEYCCRSVCIYCDGPLVQKSGGHRDHEAMIWTGSHWESVKHSSKICSGGCQALYKLNYVAGLKGKWNHLDNKDITDSTILLVHPGLGFRWEYLRQLWIRTCRCAVACAAEAATILLTHPDYKPIYTDKGRNRKQNSSDDRYLGAHLSKALMCYMRIELEHNLHFDVNDPVPSNSPTYGSRNTGFFEIFNAAVHDTSFDSRGQKDVVADGNCNLTRKIGFGELAHKFKTKQGKTTVQHGKIKPNSRCAAVGQAEVPKHVVVRRTCGLWVTMDMLKRGKYGGLNEVLHLGEMLNHERPDYKRMALKQMKQAKISVGDYAGDCNCQYHQWKGELFNGRCLLDSYHWKKHKCSTKKVTKKKCNSQAAEQFWSRLDKFSHFITKFNRPHYRFFLRMFCKWHNSYTRCGKFRALVNPMISRKKTLKKSK